MGDRLRTLRRAASLLVAALSLRRSSARAAAGDQAHVGQAELFLEELLRHEDAQLKRIESMHSRAATLVSAAAIATTLQSPLLGDPWVILGVVLTLVAAVAGVVALWPARTLNLDLQEAWKVVWKGSRQSNLVYLIDKKTAVIGQRAKYLTRTAWTVRVGFGFLAGSILASVALAISNVAGAG